MAFCPHCNQRNFEIEELEVGGSRYKCVQCSGCRAPVAFIERARAIESVDNFETRITEVLRVVVASLQTISSRLSRIEQMIQTRG